MGQADLEDAGTAWLHIILPTYLPKAAQAELLQDMATTKLRLLFSTQKQRGRNLGLQQRPAACRTNMGKHSPPSSRPLRAMTPTAKLPRPALWRAASTSSWQASIGSMNPGSHFSFTQSKPPSDQGVWLVAQGDPKQDDRCPTGHPAKGGIWMRERSRSLASWTKSNVMRWSKLTNRPLCVTARAKR